jgi:protein-disulfide isomerase
MLALFLFAALGFGVAAIKEHIHSRVTLQLAAQGRYNASPEEVLGKNPRFRGASTCPFTLVEFGDYQCPPCRYANPKIMSLLAHHKQEIRFVFRDLPLTSIHPLAMQAATVAEEAGSPSDFWSIHDLLYKGGSLGQGTILRAQQALKKSGVPLVSEGAARDIVNEAMDEASSLGIRGTPTFVLICPNGIVRRVASIDQVVPLITPDCGSSSPCVETSR